MEQVAGEDLKKCSDAATRFLSRFNVVKLLGECGDYKEKGVPVIVIERIPAKNVYPFESSKHQTMDLYSQH